MLDQIFLGNTVKDYLWFLFFILLGFIVSGIIVFISKRFLTRLSNFTKNKVDDIISRILSKPLPFKIVILTIFFNIGFARLSVSAWWDTAIKQVSFLIYVLAVTLFLIKFFIGLIEEYFETYAEKTDSKYDDQLIPLLKSLIKIFLFIIAVLLVLSNFGYNISALLAGLGIGGLALAMASKDIVENFLAGIVIFIEKPFKIDDVLTTKDGAGTVEEIGIRSTKVRTFDNTLIVVPNRELSSFAVENISQRRARKENFTLGLTYGTSLKKMEEGKKIVTNILNKNKNVEKDSFYVTFESFGDFSLNIRVIYWIPGNYDVYMKTKDEVNTAIKKEFEKAKIDFALPTQTIELKK
ncbi:MAG: mechanosensitive ion channel family protein [Candidatus ainarchaeum sp.]|nr:mechanosensitive ion channel family protein [Candidatus ainarchaeum sp.]